MEILLKKGSNCAAGIYGFTGSLELYDFKLSLGVFWCVKRLISRDNLGGWKWLFARTRRTRFSRVTMETITF
jgi:hypothetical protein